MKLWMRIHESFYAYVKSHGWASNWGSKTLALLERLWAHLLGWVRRGQRLSVTNRTSDGLDHLVSHPSVRELEIPFPAQRLVNQAPNSIYPTDPEMFDLESNTLVPPGFVARIEGGYVWRDGAVMTPDGVLVEESVAGDPTIHPTLTRHTLPRYLEVQGTVGVLATTWGRGFYHWVFDSLARLAILDTLSHLPDTLLVNYKHLRFHREWLAALEIDSRTVRSTFELPFVRADEIWLTQIPGKDLIIPAYAANYLRDKLIGTSEHGSAGRRIYISRRRAAKRRIENEEAVSTLLEANGFETVELEQVSLADRTKLLAGSGLIVTPEGSGMTNLLFCPEGTKVIELFSHRHREPPFGWNLANRLGHDYFYVLGSPDQPGHVPLDDLRQTIEMAASRL